MTWQESAACRDADPDLFFPTPPYAAQVVKRTIDQYCRGCSVLLACRDAGRAESDGVWGGALAGEVARRAGRDYRRRWYQREVAERQGAALLDALVAEQEQPPVDPWSRWRQLLNDIDSTSDQRRKDTA